jgi:hypothetical protein
VKRQTKQKISLSKSKSLFGAVSFFLLSSLLGYQIEEQSIHLENVYSSSNIQFKNINGDRNRKKYLFEAKGGGVALLDFDDDGWLDILFSQGSTLEAFRNGIRPSAALYRNLRNGKFEDETSRAGLVTSGWGTGVAVADYDNDGFPDIYLTCLTENVLYRNKGNGQFEDITRQAGVAGTHWSSSAGFADYDSDGDLDLFVCNYVLMDLANLPEPGSGPRCNYRGQPTYCGPLGLEGAPNILYRNRGDGTFEDVTEKSGVNVRNNYFSLGVVWADIDNDNDPDLFVGNDSTPNQLFLNRGDGTFEEVGLFSGLAANADGRFQASMGIDIADFNNDGLLDVYAAHFANDYSTLYLNKGDRRFQDITTEAHIVQPEWLFVSWGAGFFDLNHDGWKDILHSNGHVYPFLSEVEWDEQYGQPLSLYLNNRDGRTFTDISHSLGKDPLEKIAGRGVAFGDLDNDGDIDVVIANLNDCPQVFRNNLSNQNHWVVFRLVGTESNRDGIGARLTLETSGLRQVWEIKRTVGIYSASDPRAHFGLGTETQVKKLTVQWPSGKVDEFEDIKADSQYTIHEESGITQKQISELKIHSATGGNLPPDKTR